MANRCSSSRSRGGGTSSISALAASMRNFGFDGPGRRAAAQPGELLADQVLPADLRGGGLPLPLGLGQHERGVPALVGVDDAVVDLPGPLADRVEEPAVVGDHDQRRRAAAPGGAASQATASTSRWLVGSSRTIRSWSPSSSAASEQRRRSPPDSPSDRAVEGDAGEQHLDDLAGARVGGPLVVGAARRAPPRARVWVSSSCVALVEVADRAGPRVRETRPASGCSSPAITSSSVVLPSPLRPTMPIRSPARDAEARPRRAAAGRRRTSRPARG